MYRNIHQLTQLSDPLVRHNNHQAYNFHSCQSYKKEEIPVIALLDGENACPPEDCNGIWGYREMLKALEKPRSKAAREYKEWLGYNFDPTEFDLDETRGLLAEIID